MQGKSSGLPQGETGPRDIQMIIPLHQLRIPHIQDLERYLFPKYHKHPKSVDHNNLDAEASRRPFFNLLPPALSLFVSCISIVLALLVLVLWLVLLWLVPPSGGEHQCPCAVFRRRRTVRPRAGTASPP